MTLPLGEPGEGDVRRRGPSAGAGYIQVNGYNAPYTKQTTGLSFIVNRLKIEPGWAYRAELQ